VRVTVAGVEVEGRIEAIESSTLRVRDLFSRSLFGVAAAKFQRDDG